MVAISSVPVGRGGVIDEEWAVTNAIRVWGSRSVRQAVTVGPVGRQREARSAEASLLLVQLTGAVFISAQPTRSEGGAAVFVGFSARRGLVRVTAQERVYGRLHNRLFDLRRTARGGGHRSLGPCRGSGRGGTTASGRRPLPRPRASLSSTQGPGLVTTRGGSSTSCAVSKDATVTAMESLLPPAVTLGEPWCSPSPWGLRPPLRKLT